MYILYIFRLILPVVAEIADISELFGNKTAIRFPDLLVGQSCFALDDDEMTGQEGRIIL